MKRDDVRALLAQAALGDEAASNQIADLLHRLSWDAAPKTDPGDKGAFLDTVNEFRSNNRDLVKDPAAWAAVTEADAYAAEHTPDLDAGTRLNVIGGYVRGGGMGGTQRLDEDLDRSSAIQEIARSRARSNTSGIEGADDNNSEAIARMAATGHRRVR